MVSFGVERCSTKYSDQIGALASWDLKVEFLNPLSMVTFN